MNKRIFIFFWIFIPTVLLAQRTVEVRNRETNEIYNVLRSDRAVRHGEYQRFISRNTPLILGQYKFGEKVGIWAYFAPGRADLSAVYCYDRERFIFRNPEFHDGVSIIIVDEKFVDTILCTPVSFVGGKEEMTRHFIHTVRYPAAAREAGISGTVLVMVKIDRFGNAANHHVIRPLSHGLSEEALRVIIALPNTWQPGTISGQPVDTMFVIPLIFKLSG